MRNLLAVIVLLAARAAFAQGGISINEQSAPGVGMAGAQVAVADDPAAIYYNPAGIAFQPGFGAILGGNVLVTRTHVSPDALTIWHGAYAPTVYVAQRFGRYVAFGIGAFSNMDEHFEYPPNWRGRFVGYEIDVLTATIQPTLAIRVTPWLSLGGGFDIVPASVELFRGLNFGGAEGNIHLGFNDVGIGGNIGLLVDLIPKHLRIGVAYRSRVDLSLAGNGSISAPPELRSMTGGLQNASALLPLPHHFSFGAAFLGHHWVADAEVKVAVWREIQTLTATITDPQAPAGTPPITEPIVLNLHNTWGIRGGVQYGFGPGERFRVRLGIGYDDSAIPRRLLSPLLPDTDRVLASGGFGMRFGWLRVDLGYMAVWVLKETSALPDLVATYQTFAQVINLSLTVRWEHVLQRMHVSTTFDDGE